MGDHDPRQRQSSPLDLCQAEQSVVDGAQTRPGDQQGWKPQQPGKVEHVVVSSHGYAHAAGAFDDHQVTARAQGLEARDDMRQIHNCAFGCGGHRRRCGKRKTKR